MTIVKFSCSDCKVEVGAAAAILERGVVKLLGACPECGVIFRFPVDQIIHRLQEEDSLHQETVH